MAKILRIVLPVLLFLTLTGAALGAPGSLPVIRASLGGASLTVELAATHEQRYQGLSDRSYLAPDRGMLFVYPSPRPLTFVMRKMLIPLDFVWIRRGKVVGLNHEVPPPKPGEFPRRIPSPSPADRVLEVNAGWIKANRIKLGDSFKLGN